MIVFTAPEVPHGHLTNTLFLAGSIEMGKAIDWQQRVIDELKDVAGVIYNPRRKDWNPSWAPGSPDLRSQIQWELEQLEQADTIFFYFQGDTLSPVSMAELGMTCTLYDIFSEQGLQVVVTCDMHFWRRTNVEVMCDRYGIRVYDTLGDGLVALKKAVDRF